MFNKKKKNNKGFTLVELLVVIAIIGILAVVAVPSLMKNINKANASDAVSYISAVKTSSISLYAEGKTGTVTTDVAALVDDKPSDVDLDSVTISSSGAVVINVKVKNDDIAKMVKDQLGITDASATTSSNTTINVSSKSSSQSQAGQGTQG